MTTPQTVADYVTLARQAIAAGNVEDATKFTDQAKALKALDGLGDTQPRLPFGDGDAPAAPEAGDYAVKSWFVKRYGEIDSGMAQIAKELYGGDYARVAYAKSGDFLRYVKTGQYDPRLHRMVLFSPGQIVSALAGGATVSELKATQIEAQDVLGGYLVPEDIRDRLVERLSGAVVMRRLNAAISTGRDRVTMPVALGGDDRYIGASRAFWVDESPTGSQSQTNATFGQISIPVFTMMSNVPVSKNLLEDSTGATSIVSILERQLANAFIISEDQAFLTGSGVGQPLGILRDNSTGGPNTYQYGAVATLNSGAATALTADALRNTPYQIASQYRDAGCSWVFSRGTARVIMTLKAGDGTYLWSGRSDTPQLAQGQPRALESYPIAETEAMGSPTTTSGSAYTANSYPILFMARDAYQIVDRIGMDVMRYDDSTTAVTNSIVLVARRRVGGQLTEPWKVAAMKISA